MITDGYTPAPPAPKEDPRRDEQAGDAERAFGRRIDCTPDETPAAPRGRAGRAAPRGPGNRAGSPADRRPLPR